MEALCYSGRVVSDSVIALGKSVAAPGSFTALTRLEHNWEKTGLALTVGTIVENGSVLGTLSSGALRLGQGATTIFSDLSGYYSGREFSFVIRAAGGLTRVQGQEGSLIENVSALSSFSFAAAVSRAQIFTSRDRLGLAFSSPLRIESGSLSLNLPNGRDYVANQILFAKSSTGLQPSARSAG